MRLFLFILLFFSCACAPVEQSRYATLPVDAVVPTEISGVLTGETVLQGDYLLVSDLLIPKGSRLLIKPATSILVRRAEMTKIDPEFLSSMTELLIRGTVRIEGTAEAPVIIASEKNASPDDPGWAGLLLDNAEASSIRYAQIRGAETGLLMIDAEVELTDSQLEQNRYGVVIQSGAPLLERNRISHGEGGVFVWNGASPRLVDNTILENEEEGLFIDRSSRPTLNNNRSERNAIGLASTTLPTPDALRLFENGKTWRELLPRTELKK